MKVLQSIKTVFASSRPLVWIIYVIQLVFALVLAWIACRTLNAALGQSMSLGRLIGEFDYTIWMDLRNRQSEYLSDFWMWLAVLLPVCLVATSAASGGIYKCLDVRNNKFSTFLKGVRTYWWRYFIISIISLAVLFFWSLLVWKWYLNDLFVFLEYWRDDRHIAWLALLLVLVWTLGAYFIFVWNNLAKIDQLDCRCNPFKSLATQIKVAVKASIALVAPMLAIALLGILITLGYLAITSTLKPSAVIMLLLLQQLVTWVKVGFRITAYEVVRLYRRT